MRVPNHGTRPAWQLDDAPTPVALIGAGFDHAERTCWQQIGAVNGLPMGEPTAAGLLDGFCKRYERIHV